jgi:hypothetical protein
MNKEVLLKGVKKAFIAIPLMFIGPSVIYNAFINKQNVWHYLVLAVGIAISFAAVYLMFKGIQTMTKGLFDDKN